MEEEILNIEYLKSSLEHKLSIKFTDSSPKLVRDPYYDGIAYVFLDITKSPVINEQKLFDWHKLLINEKTFSSIDIGKYRSGKMQVVSGSIGKEKVHYEAVIAATGANFKKIFF
jgi:hypothetical protein